MTTLLLILLAIAIGWAVDRFLLGGEFTRALTAELRDLLKGSRRRPSAQRTTATPPTFGRR